MSASEAEDALVETGRFVAHAWLCDANGHLNTRHYQGFFDDANLHLLGACGHEAGAQGPLSIADVRCAMAYKAEVAPGRLLMARSGFAALGRTSFTSVHELRSIDGATLFASCEIVSVFFNRKLRASAPMPDDFRAKAACLLRSADIMTNGET